MTRGPERRHAAAGLVAALAVAVLLGGCGAVAPDPTAATASPSPAASASPAGTASVAPAGTATPSPAPSASPHAEPPASRQVTEADDRGTVTLRTGGTLSLVLHSTYWQLDPPSDPSVLRSQGDPGYAPVLPPGCVPGGGCGTVTAAFHALRPGRAVITAHRSSCGEALACTGDAGRFSVTVVVSD